MVGGYQQVHKQMKSTHTFVIICIYDICMYHEGERERERDRANKRERAREGTQSEKGCHFVRVTQNPAEGQCFRVGGSMQEFLSSQFRVISKIRSVRFRA